MTMHHIMNCAHSDDGWCLDCVIKLNNRVEALASLATTLRRRLDAAENEIEMAHELLDRANVDESHIIPLVDRIVCLVSMLATGGATPAELDAVVDSHTVDALARRVDALERFAAVTTDAIATQLEDEDRYRKQLDMLEMTVSNLQRLAAEVYS